MIPTPYRKLRTSAAAVLTACCLAACVGTPTPVGTLELTPINEISTIEQAETAWRSAEIIEQEAVWQQFSTANGDPYLAGLAAYRLAVATDQPEWSKAAIQSFEDIDDVDHITSTRAEAALGASHRMAARNYPVPDALQFVALGAPRWQRLYQVRTSVSLLNRAVETAPNDPVVRLYRATAFTGMPSMFGVADEAEEDFALLEAWISNPMENAEFAELLSDQDWLEDYYLTRARSMEAATKNELAIASWQALKDIAVDPYVSTLATLKAAP